MNRAHTVVSTFAGCGGSSLGHQMAGGKVVLAVEWDDNAVETYHLNFPKTRVYHGDIAKLSVAEALSLCGLREGELDVLDGSPPCQGFSVAGKRKIDDPRNGLFREFVRLLRGLKPRLFVMENVTGLVKGDMRRVFSDILVALEESGYRVSVRVLNAAWYGVPQARRRVIFVGARSDLNVEPSHPLPTHTPISVRQALVGVPVDADELEWLREQGAKQACFRVWNRVKPGRRADDVLNGSGFSASKLHPDKPSHTLQKNDGEVGMHGTMHWRERRRPTVYEYKRLFSFPDDFKFAGSWGDAVSRMGNSVPPLLMRAVSAHIRSTVLGLNP